MIVGHEITGMSYSSEEIENLINKWEEDKQELESIIIMLFPTILLQLLLKDRLDIDKINDREYLIRKIAAFSKEIGPENAFYITGIDNDFIKAAKDAIEAEQNEVAIVLIATALEHILNIYYRYILRLNDFNDEAITEIIRNSKFRDKIGWLMKLIFKMDLEENLIIKINQTIELRNQIVHYKAVPFILDDEAIEDNRSSCNNIKNKVEKLDFDILELPEKLEKILLSQIIKLYPQMKIVEEMMEVIFKHKIKFLFSMGI